MVSPADFVLPVTEFFDFPISSVWRGNADDVMDELDKLRRDHPVKSAGQMAIEVIAEIDSLHEGIDHWQLRHVCAECHTAWPCATHRAIYGETRENCVHRI